MDKNLERMGAILFAVALHTALALVFLYTTFETQAGQGKFQNWIGERLDRLEAKIDHLSERNNGGD